MLDEQAEKEALRRALSANGKKGGKATLTRYGVNHLSKIAKRGGEATRKLWQKRNQEAPPKPSKREFPHPSSDILIRRD